jgi:hypothetical protein
MPSPKIIIAGKKTDTPTAEINGVTVISTGTWLKIASVYDEEIIPGDTVADPGDFIRQILAAKIPADIFSFAPKFSEKIPHLAYPHDIDNWAILPVSTYDHWLTKQIGTDVRQNIKKAPKRGVTARLVPFDEEFLSGIMEIYNETPIRQGRKFWHYGKSRENVRLETFRHMDRSHFIGAYFENKLIGFVKMTCTNNVADLGLILTRQSHYEQRAPNALIAKAVEICAENGIGNLRYAKMSYGKKRDSSLADYKRRNGFKEIEYPRYYVPLTLKGRIAVQLRLYRQIQDIIPERIQNIMQKLRMAYYSRFVLSKNEAPTKE